MRSLILRSTILCGLLTAAPLYGADNIKPGSRGASLVVNDSDALGTVGDGKLSLAEAIRLTGGDLAIDQLDPRERRQVRGMPGAHRRDRISFAVPGGVVSFPQQIEQKPAMDFAVLSPVSKMPVLRGNEGDEIDGRGVRFTNGPDRNDGTSGKDAPIGGMGLVIESSHFTIRNATFERFTLALSFQPAAGSTGLVSTQVIDGKFLNGGGISFTAVSAARERSTLRDILVQGNQFIGPGQFGGAFPSKLHNAISIVGASAAVAKDSASAPDAVLEDIRIAGNTVREFAGGIQVQPLQTLFMANRGARLSRLMIEKNDISLGAETGDPAVYLWGAVSVNGQVSDVTVSDIVVRKNRIVGNGHILFIAGVEALMGGTTASRNIHLRNVDIISNNIRARISCSHGITTIGAFPEMNGPPAVANSVTAIEVSKNDVVGCDIGAFAAPVLNVGAPGESRDNIIDGLTYRSNRISASRLGIVVTGGAFTPAAFEGTATIRSNRVNNAKLANNRVEASETPILIAGGFATGNGKGVVRDNLVKVSLMAGNIDLSNPDTNPCRLQDNQGRNSVTLIEANRAADDTSRCMR